MTASRSTSTTRSERISKRRFLEEERHGVRLMRLWGNFLARISWSFLYSRVDKNAKTVEQLDAYTKERWDQERFKTEICGIYCIKLIFLVVIKLKIFLQILSFLTQEQGKLSEEVISLLKYAGLCDANGEKRFQFLLLDRSSQGILQKLIMFQFYNWSLVFTRAVFGICAEAWIESRQCSCICSSAWLL